MRSHHSRGLTLAMTSDRRGSVRATTITAVLSLLFTLALVGCEGEAVREQETGEVAPASPAATTAIGDFGDLDADRDARLTNDEFNQWWRDRGLFGRWNTDASDGLTDAELSTGLFNTWDRNEAGITESEWNTGVRTWFPSDASYGAYGDWDANDNNLIEENEFREGLGRHNLFDTWDANRNDLWEEDEVFGGFFEIFDANDDRGIDENEWNTGYRDWDWGF